MTRKKQTLAVFLLLCGAISFIWADPDMTTSVVESPFTGSSAEGQTETENMTLETSISSGNDSQSMSYSLSGMTTGQLS